MSPSFRRLNSLDANACFSIWEELESHYDHPVGSEWDAFTIKDEIEKHHAWGAFNGEDELEAFCLFRRQQGTVEIMLLATRPRVHRSGAMRSLIRSIVDELSPEETVWLEVHAGNLPAIALYESLGFLPVGEREAYYPDGGKALLFEYKPLQ